MKYTKQELDIYKTLVEDAKLYYNNEESNSKIWEKIHELEDLINKEYPAYDNATYDRITRVMKLFNI